jgi:hypothetical protein
MHSGRGKSVGFNAVFYFASCISSVLNSLIVYNSACYMGYGVAQLVEALCYGHEGSGFYLYISL